MELDRYNRENNSLSPDAPPLIAPSPFSVKDVPLASIRIGDRISVRAAENIRTAAIISPFAIAVER